MKKTINVCNQCNGHLANPKAGFVIKGVLLNADDTRIPGVCGSVPSETPTPRKGEHSREQHDYAYCIACFCQLTGLTIPAKKG